jgi:hypothetical protein
MRYLGGGVGHRYLREWKKRLQELYALVMEEEEDEDEEEDEEESENDDDDVDLEEGLPDDIQDILGYDDL